MFNFVAWIDRTFYSEFGNNWDDRIFREEIGRYLSGDSVALDYGAGRGNVSLMNFRGQCARVCGVDPDDAVLGNPFLDDAKVLDVNTGTIDYPDSTFDLVFSDNVMEHVDQPAVVLRELARVLKPGGLLLFKTPNKCHYMPLVASVTPLWFHRLYNRMRGRSEVDTFPTRYRLNTKNDILREASNAGLEVSSIDVIEGRPEYLRVFWFSYFFGVLYERIVNASERLTKFRCVILGVLVKPSSSHT